MEFDALLAEMEGAHEGGHGAAAASSDGVEWSTLQQQARALEKQIKQQARPASAAGSGSSTKGGGSSNYAQEKKLFSLRKTLRGLYAQMLAADVALAAQHETEQQLWKTSVYKQIESLRKLMREAAATFASAQRRGTQAAQQQAQQRLQKLHECSVHFLRECMRFYEELCLKHLPFAGWSAVEPAQQSAGLTELSLASLQLHPLSRAQLQQQGTPLSAELRQLHLDRCYRSLIFRGDLERYHLLIGEETNAVGQSAAAVPAAPGEKPWARVTAFYRHALTLCPDQGNPYNQIAVVDSYATRPFDATSNYLRALSAAHPFVTAQVNVQLLLEKYRARADLIERHAQHHARPMASVVSPLLFSCGGQACGFFMPGAGKYANPDQAELELHWLQLFDLLYVGAAHPHAASAPSLLPCLAEGILYRISFQGSPWAPFPAGDLHRCLQLLLNLLCLLQRAESAQQSISAAADGTIDSSAATAFYTFSLSFLFSFMHLMTRSPPRPTHDSFAVVVVFLAWLRLHPTTLSDSSPTPREVRQRLLHNLAALGNDTMAFVQKHRELPRPTGDDAAANEPAALPEDVEVRGCALLADELVPSLGVDVSHSSSSFSSASILLAQPSRRVDDGEVHEGAAAAAMSDDDERMGEEDGEEEAASKLFVPRTIEERRAVRLLLQLDWLAAQPNSALAKQSRGVPRFYSELDSAPVAAPLLPPLPPPCSTQSSSQRSAAVSIKKAAADVAPHSPCPASSPARSSPIVHVEQMDEQPAAAMAPSPPRPAAFVAPVTADTGALSASHGPLRQRAAAAGAELMSAYASLMFGEEGAAAWRSSMAQSSSMQMT